MAVAYGHGTSANGGCEDCWEVPGRHCCLWNEPTDRIMQHRRTLAKDGAHCQAVFLHPAEGGV